VFRPTPSRTAISGAVSLPASRIRLQLLREALLEFEVSDPDDRLAVDLARYGRDAIVRAISVFRTKRQRGTLASTAHPGRYFGGFVRKIDEELELQLYAKNLRDTRQRLHDLTLNAVAEDLAILAKTVPTQEQPRALVEQALRSESRLAFQMYLDAAAGILMDLPKDTAEAIVDELTTIISRAYSVPKARKLYAITVLVEAPTLL